MSVSSIAPRRHRVVIIGSGAGGGTVEGADHHRPDVRRPVALGPRVVPRQVVDGHGAALGAEDDLHAAQHRSGMATPERVTGPSRRDHPVAARPATR